MHDIPAGSKAAESAQGGAPLPQRSDAPAASGAVIAPAPAPAAVRNVAVDAYRGFVMFLMMAEVLQLARVAAAYPGNWLIGVLAYHQTHVAWAGASTLPLACGAHHDAPFAMVPGRRDSPGGRARAARSLQRGAVVRRRMCIGRTDPLTCSSHEERQPPNAQAQLQAVGSICGSPAWMH